MFYYFILFRCKYSPRHSFLSVGLRSHLNVRDQYETTGKIIVLYILIFASRGSRAVWGMNSLRSLERQPVTVAERSEA
jgi:hypothetical protein